MAGLSTTVFIVSHAPIPTFAPLRSVGTVTVDFVPNVPLYVKSLG